MNTFSRINYAKKRWLAVRKRAATSIDPATAVQGWKYGKMYDPYGVKDQLPDRYEGMCCVYFARRPKSRVWVWVGDLPKATQIVLCFKRRYRGGEWLRKTPPIARPCRFGETV